MKLNLTKEIYHGYDDDYIDGTLILMESNNGCAYPTRNWFGNIQETFILESKQEAKLKSPQLQLVTIWTFTSIK